MTWAYLTTNRMSDALCIVHETDITEPSGGTDRVVNFAGGLTERGVDVSLVVPDPNNQPPQALDEVNIVSVSPSRLQLKSLFAAKLVRKGKRLAADRDARFQIEHSSLAGVAAGLGCSGYVLDMHDLVFPSPRFGSLPVISNAAKQVERLGVSRASHTVVVSTPMQDVLYEIWNVPASDVYVIPNGYTPSEVEGFAEKNTVEGHVGFIGTLHPKLDYETFVELAKRPEVESVLVIGDGKVYDDLKAAAERNGVADSITLTGRIPGDEAYERLASAEVFVYPIDESEHTRMLSSVKIFDYAALERPMVLDDVSESDVWKRFKVEDAASFADPHERRDFVDKVCQLLDDENRKEELTRNAREIVEEYRWEHQVDRIGEVHETLRNGGS